MVNLKSIKGSYFVSVTCKDNVNITALLIREQLTHISPLKDYFFDKEGVYQMFTNNSNVLAEVYSCQGDLYLLASKKL